MTTQSLKALLILAQNSQWRSIFTEIQQAAEDVSASVYLVGGALRDALLGLESTISDVDVTVEGDAIALASVLAERWQGKVKPYPNFQTARVIPGIELPGGMKEIDFASTRTEEYPVPGGKPIITMASLQEDLYRRDFTINGLALSLATLLTETSEAALIAHIQDPGKGMNDLSKRCIRIFHKRSFIDDPTRLLRAMRYRVLIDGTLSAETETALKERLQGGVFPEVNAQRFGQEFIKTMQAMTLKQFCSEWLQLGFVDHLPLFTRTQSNQVIDFVEELDERTLPERWKEQAFLCACYHWYGQRESAIFSSMSGTAKKQCRRWLRDCTSSVEHCATATLIAYAGTGGALPIDGLDLSACKQEIEKRYQLYEQQ